MKSANDVDFMLNPSEEVWKELVKQASVTENWSFQWTDYETWKQSFKNFWFYAAIEKASGKFVASVAIAQDNHLEGQDELFILGQYYCLSEWRGSGIGTKLFKLALQHAGDENVECHGVMNMAHLYSSKYGFNKMKHIKCSASILMEDFVKVGGIDGITTKPLSEVPWELVVAYDRTINPRERSNYLKTWISNAGTHARVAFDSSQNIVGFCCIREDIASNLTVRPLYADSKDVAQTLLSSTLATIDLPKFKKLRFLFPEVNEECKSLMSLFSSGRFSSSRYVHSQFTKYVIATPDQKVFSALETQHSLI